MVSIRVMVATYGKEASIDSWMALAILSGSAAVGALLGAIMALKDRVECRLKDDHHVAYPLRILFGYGLWSLLVVWSPLVILSVIFLMPLALAINRN